MMNTNFHIRVAVRTRPLLASDYQRISTINNPQGIATAVHVIRDNNSILMIDPVSSKPTHQYFFDKVFFPEESTEDVYSTVAQQIVFHAVKGYNGTIFAYGQTSTGKTHTVFGHTDSYPGIVPMAINDIFDQIEAAGKTRVFFVRLAALEIYNERLTDLAAFDLTQKRKPLRIRETQTGFIFVENLIEEVCTTRESAMHFLNECLTRRHMAETLANDDSSRSHVICRIVIESRPAAGEEGGSSSAGADFDAAPITIGELNFVDLAGSECAVRITQPTNIMPMHSIGSNFQTETSVRLKEGRSINRSLLMLGIVINQLSESRPIVNYRNSKLTRILQNALGGNSLTAIVCTISPTEADKRQTVSTLQFASNAKSIKTKPHLNETFSPDKAILRRLQLEIERLRHRIVELEMQQSFSNVASSSSSERRQLHENERILLNMIAGGVKQRSQESSAHKKPLLSRRMTWAPTASGHAILMFTGEKERSESASSDREDDGKVGKSLIFTGMVRKIGSEAGTESRGSQDDSPNRSTADKEPLTSTIDRIENEEVFRERFIGRQYFDVVARNYEKLKLLLEQSLGTPITEEDDFSEVSDKISDLVTKSRQLSIQSELDHRSPSSGSNSGEIKFTEAGANQTPPLGTSPGSEPSVMAPHRPKIPSPAPIRIIRRTAMSARLPPIVIHTDYVRPKSMMLTTTMKPVFNRTQTTFLLSNCQFSPTPLQKSRSQDHEVDESGPKGSQESTENDSSMAFSNDTNESPR